MILVTGATGFLGGFVVKKLLAAGRGPLRCFVRSTSDLETLQPMLGEVELCQGSFEDYPSLLRALKGVDTLINVASLGFGHAPAIVQACAEAGVRRGIFFSTTAVFTGLDASSKVVRLAAEQLIKSSGLQYTILRPTMIYGTPRDRNMSRLIRYLQRFPVIPVFGSGEFLQQPVYVEDLAEAVYQVLQQPVTVNREYNLAGAAPLTYNQVLDLTAGALGRKVYKIHLPVSLSVKLLQGYALLSNKPKLKAEQVLRLNEHKAFAIDEAVRDFSYRPIDFAEGIRREAAIVVRESWALC